MSTVEYKCPNCGGSVSFNSKTQKMVCDFCDTEFDQAALEEYNKQKETPEESQFGWGNYDQNSGNGDWKEGEQEQLSAFICPNCGGEIVGDSTMAATHCPYCDNPAIMPKQLEGMYRPDYVIPFKLDKNDAKLALKNYLNGKKLLPNFFKSENRIDSITGMYVPFWLFDCDTHANIRYKATRTSYWSDSEYQYTKTDYYAVARSGSIGFQNVLVDGSSKMEDTYMESIEPFHYEDLKEFHMMYLSGYLADKYDVNAEQSVERANERIKNSTVAAFANTVTGYQTCVPENINVQLKQGGVHYALLPVWMLNTKYKDKIYTFAMNGQTGKFIGDLPVDWGKYWAWFAGIFAGVFSVASAILLLI